MKRKCANLVKKIQLCKMSWRRQRVSVLVTAVLVVSSIISGYLVGYKRAKARCPVCKKQEVSRDDKPDGMPDDVSKEAKTGEEIEMDKQNLISSSWSKEWEKLDTILNPAQKDCMKIYSNVEMGQFDIKFFNSWRQYIEMFRKYPLQPGVQVEGHVGNILYQTQAYYRLARLNFIKNICEIGFNAGHSAYIWLAASPKTMLFSFDLGEHQYTQPMAKYMEQNFLGRFKIFYGDSTVTVPEFRRKNPEIKCDLMIVDGGHTYSVAKADLVNMRLLANKQRNLVILDDYPSKMLDFMQVLGRAWTEMKTQKKIDEIFSCTAGYTGFTVGRYLF